MGIDIAKSTRTATFVDAADYLLSLPPVEHPQVAAPVPEPAPVVVAAPLVREEPAPSRSREVAIPSAGDAQDARGGIGTSTMVGLGGLVLVGFVGLMSYGSDPSVEVSPVAVEAPAPVVEVSPDGYVYDKVRVDAIAANLKVETDRLRTSLVGLPAATAVETSVAMTRLAQGVRDDVVAYRLDAATRGIAEMRAANDALASASSAPVARPALPVPAPVAAPQASFGGYVYDRARIAELGTALRIEMATAFESTSGLPDGSAAYARVEEAAAGIRRSIVDNRLDAAADALGALRADVAVLRNQASALPSVAASVAPPTAAAQAIPGTFAALSDAVVGSSKDPGTASATKLVAARLAAPAAVAAGEYGRREAWDSFADWRAYLDAPIEIFAGVSVGPGEIDAAVAGVPGKGLPAETPSGLSVRTDRIRIFFGPGEIPARGDVVARKEAGSAVFEWTAGRVPEIRRWNVEDAQTLLMPGDAAWKGVSYMVKGY